MFLGRGCQSSSVSGTAGHRDAAARDGLLGCPTSPIENVEAGRAGGTVVLSALVGLDEEVVTIGVKEIGRAQGAGSLGSRGQKARTKKARPRKFQAI